MPPIEKPRSFSKADRYFHTIAATVLIVLMLTGFHHFYFQGRAYPGRGITPPIRGLVITHGSAMALWMLIFLVQPLLILTDNRKLHRKVGTAAAVIAAFAFLLGIKLGVEAARVKPPGMIVDGLDAVQFMAIPVLSMLAFGGCVAAAIAYRRNPAVHRTCILIGTLFAISAAVARIDFLTQSYAGTVFDRIWGPFFMTLVVALLLLALKSVLSRKLDTRLAMGCAGLGLFLAFNFQIASTAVWASVGHMLIRALG